MIDVIRIPDGLLLIALSALEQLSGSLSRQSVTSVGEPRHGIVAGNRLDGETNRFLERFLGARAQSAQDGFDLGEGLLDGSDVGRVDPLCQGKQVAHE